MRRTLLVGRSAVVVFVACINCRVRDVSAWGCSARRGSAPEGLGLSCQASAAAVDAAHVDVAAFTAGLAARVGVRATGVAQADTRYLAQEAVSATELAALAPPVTSV
jgi:hypothetical protein